jgi:hypothetical protein
MPRYYLVEDHTVENPNGHPEKDWPLFKDAPSLMAWYGLECKKLRYGISYRLAVIALRNYCRQNKAVQMDENCWSKFLSFTSKDDSPLWHFGVFSSATTPWYSRANDIALASLLEKSFFPPPKPPKPGDEAKARWRTRVLGRRMYVHGPDTALAAALEWLVSKPDVITEIGPDWSYLLNAVSSWEGEVRPYVNRLKRDFSAECIGLVIRCTHRLLAPELRLPFLTEMIPLLSESPINYTYLFQIHTDYNLWEPSDWFPRDAAEAIKFNDSPKARGLKWADNNTNYNWRKRESEFRRVLSKLPDYAVTVLLEDALLYPSKRDNLPIWPELLRLPLERRDALLRTHCGKVGELWPLCRDFFSEEGDDDYRKATLHILNSLLPEHSDTWATGASLGLSMTDMFFYLDGTRESHTMIEVALPEDLVF